MKGKCSKGATESFKLELFRYNMSITLRPFDSVEVWKGQGRSKGSQRPQRVKCCACGRKFSSKSQIERHLKTLIMKVLCKCIVCQRFYSLGNYCDHDEGSKTFHCEFCGIQIDEPHHLHACFHFNAKQMRRSRDSKRINSRQRKRKEAMGDIKEELVEVKLTINDYEYPSFVDATDEPNKEETNSYTEDPPPQLPDPSLSDIDDTDTCIYCDTKMPAVLLSKHETWHRKFDKNVRSLTDPRSSRLQRNSEGLCAYCGVIKPGNKLRRHEYVEHVKKYVRKVCDICGIFTCPTYIKEHMRTHGAEKGFKCGDCGKAFFRKKALARHRLVHTDVAQYMCTICGKSFKIKFNLRVHMRSHEDIKPFPCSVCKKTFTTKQWRDNHLKTHGIVASR